MGYEGAMRELLYVVTSVVRRPAIRSIRCVYAVHSRVRIYKLW